MIIFREVQLWLGLASCFSEVAEFPRIALHKVKDFPLQEFPHLIPSCPTVVIHVSVSVLVGFLQNSAEVAADLFLRELNEGFVSADGPTAAAARSLLEEGQQLIQDPGLPLPLSSFLTLRLPRSTIVDISNRSVMPPPA